jgi:hypothetical protein
MSASTTDRATKSRMGSLLPFPIAADAVLLAGCLACIDSDGYLVGGSDATGLRFAGVAQSAYDATGESDGDSTLEVAVDGEWLFASASLTQADVGKAVYILDNQTVVKSGHADLDYHIYVGRISQVVSATACWVRIEPGRKDPNLVTVTADLAGTNAAAISTANLNVSLGGKAASGVYAKEVLSMLAFVAADGSAATVCRKVITTHFTLSGGTITTVGNESANRLVTTLLGVVKE